MEEQERPIWVRVARDLAILVRDVGMPVAAFVAGLMILFEYSLLQQEVDTTKAGIGLILILAGLASWLWLHARENPAKRAESPPLPPVQPALEDQLERSMALIERLAKEQIVRRNEH